MYDEWDLAPIDSDDLYAMGLRAARCNGCEYAKFRYALGSKFLALRDVGGWVNVYELDSAPVLGQGAPLEYDGHPIRYLAGYMTIGHSDECYHWQPPTPTVEVRE